MMLSAGVAELVDALDLGSSDESCGGSSPSARTKRFQRLRNEFLESLHDAGSPSQPAQGQGSQSFGLAPITFKKPSAVRRWARERKEDLAPCRSPKPSTRD